MVYNFANQIILFLKLLFYAVLEYSKLKMGIHKDIIDAFDYCFFASLLWHNKYISDELGLGLL